MGADLDADRILQKAEERFAAAEAMQKSAQSKWESAMEMMREANQILEEAEKTGKPPQRDDEEVERWPAAPFPTRIMKKKDNAEESRKILVHGLQQGFKIIKIMFGHMD